jgi:hypothetical protein
MNCLGSDSIAAKLKTTIPIPHVEKTAVVTGHLSELDRERKEEQLTMPRNCAQTRDQCNLEATIPDDFGQASVGNFLLLEFLSA